MRDIRCLVLTATLVLAPMGQFASAKPPSELEMAARVDALLAETMASEGVEPSAMAADSEFLRRAWLDICGIIPPINHNDGISGIRDFLNDKAPDKRRRLIDALLEKPSHAARLATHWKDIMLPADSNVRRFGGDAGFTNWLRGQFADNTPYDEVAQQLLLASGQINQNGPTLYYASLQVKPEELAASTSKVFLGVQIQCAQCHDHPFDHWTRKDFWGYAAFFARLQRPQSPQTRVAQVMDVDEGEVMIPETKEPVAPKFLGGEPSPDGKALRRDRLAQWLTSGDNKYFARAAANRIWALMFGRGIVEPVDDLGEHNPPSHPELLDELSEYFVATNFDVRRLIRTLANTEAYQRSSESAPGQVDRPELFAKMAIKSLTAEQLYDCLVEATRSREQQVPVGGRAFDRNRQEFLSKFAAPAQGPTDYESGIPQALTLMNGTMIRQATDLAQSDLLTALEAPFFSDERRLEVLFLSTLSRPPSDDEAAKFAPYVRGGGATGERRKALGDVLWALLNSAEFVLNH